MPRPGFVLEVDERTPPLLVHEGEGFCLQKFPLGTRVVYPPDSLPGIRDVTGAIRSALLNPLGTEPLPELLRPGMRLTIALDDISLPLPPMRTPDIRGRIIEQVLELAARKDVDDEDPTGLTHVGTTDRGEDVEISRRAAESDLLVYVNINLVAMDGGQKSVPVGLGSYRSLRHHHN